jgi:alkylation response protein AidB-like acyl-CoA dehydrogenase
MGFPATGVIQFGRLCHAGRPMDLSTTVEQEALRDEFRSWLHEHLPWPYGEGLPPRFDDLADAVTFGRAWQAKLAAGRWVGITWPEEVGGRGLGALENYVVIEELARARAPELVGRIGINLVGPTLMAHGTAAQQQQFLPSILSAQEMWCQLFSEPAAGSDLASLTTKAVPVEGGYRVSGRKVWTSYAQFANWGLCLARSDPNAPKRQQGITALVIDMHAEGVMVHPLVQSTGEAEFNEVELDDVFVPDKRRVGPEGNGWSVAGSTLAHERGVNPRQLVMHSQLIEELIRLADANGSFDNWRLRQKLAQAATEVRLFQLHNWRSLTRLSKGEAPGPEGSALKLYWSEMSKRLHQTAMEVLGAHAPLWHGAPDNPSDGAWQRSWLYYQASSIFAGTNEIQRTLVGERVLGLPRD